VSTRTRPADGGPWRITFVTNPDDCNLGCAMCVGGVGAPSWGERDRRSSPRRLETEKVLAILEERRGTPLREVIPSTMGEPLLWDGMDALLDRCARDGLRLNLTTNGTWPGRGAAAWAERILPVASDVKISWNGATPATAAALMGGLDLTAAVADAKVLLARRDALADRAGGPPTVSFQVTAQEGNVAELGAIVRTAAALGVDRVKVNHLQVRFPSLAQHSLLRSRVSLARWNHAVTEMKAAAESTRRPDGRPIELVNAVALPKTPEERLPPGPCPFVGAEAWVLSDGRYAPCPSPSAVRGHLGEFGSIAERTVGQFWSSPELQALLDLFEEHPVCQDCPFRRPGGA
jgi:MoaA/NifB/PqqE/SkfB family radical SAM enzyme